MEVFFTLLQKLIPLYIIIFLGFFGSKYLNIKKESLAQLLVYFVAPVVLFNGILTTNLTLGTLSITLLFFLVCGIVSLITYLIAGYIWKDATKNMLAFTAGSGNTGYFGLPVAVALFGTYVIGIVALVLLGTALYANTIGFFLAAKGQHTTKESFKKVFKLPLLYAFIVGVCINLAGIQLSETYIETIEYFNGAFVVLGMMLIGIAIGEVKHLQFDMKYTGISLFAKFLLWPLVMFSVIYLDTTFFKIYDSQLYNIFLLLSVVPVAANIVSYATVLKTNPDKVSLDVLISTLFALVFIPLFISLYLL